MCQVFLIIQEFTPHPELVPKAKKPSVRKPRNLTIDEVQLSPLMVQEAIKQSKKSKGLGPDQIAPIHLHYLWPKGVFFLTHLINLSLGKCVIAQNWKVGKVFPILKP